MEDQRETQANPRTGVVSRPCPCGSTLEYRDSVGAMKCASCKQLETVGGVVVRPGQPCSHRWAH